MEEQGNERDSGFSIDDLLHETPKKNIPIKRPNNTLQNNDIDIKRDKIATDEALNTPYVPPCDIGREHPTAFGGGDVTNDYLSNTSSEMRPTTGFGIAELLSSKDSFLAKSIVVHDKKSNISQKGTTFLEKLMSYKSEESTTTNTNSTETASTYDREEKEYASNLFLTPQLDQDLQCQDNDLITGEENERTLVDTTCKLFLFDKDSNSWKNIGMVSLHVNEYIRQDDDPCDKFYTRVVARSLSLQRAVLNFKLWPNIVIDNPSENTILMQASYLNDLDNIRFISLSMKRSETHEVWKVLLEQTGELNNYLSKKETVKEYRETHDEHQDLDDDQLYELLSEKHTHAPAKKIKLLDSKKTFQPAHASSEEEDEDEDNPSTDITDEQQSSDGDDHNNAVDDDEVDSNDEEEEEEDDEEEEPHEIMVNGTFVSRPIDGYDEESSTSLPYLPNEETADIVNHPTQVIPQPNGNGSNPSDTLASDTSSPE